MLKKLRVNVEHMTILIEITVALHLFSIFFVTVPTIETKI